MGEAYKLIRYAAGYDMSSNTELSIDFEAPKNSGGTDFVVAKADGVTLGTGAVTDVFLGSLSANEYVDYRCLSTDFDAAGEWSARLTYTDSATTPTSIFIGSQVAFTVLPGD